MENNKNDSLPCAEQENITPETSEQKVNGTSNFTKKNSSFIKMLGLPFKSGRGLFAIVPLGIIVVIAIVVISRLSGLYFFNFRFSGPVTKVGPVQIIKIEKMKKIDVLKIYAGDFIKNEFSTKVDGFLYGKNDVDIMRIDMVKGYAKLSIDMEKVEQKILDKETKKLKIVLPALEIDLVNLEKAECVVISEKEKTHAHEVLKKDVAKCGKEIIRKRASSELYVDMAKKQTEAILLSMYEPLGWNLDFEWKDSNQ